MEDAERSALVIVSPLESLVVIGRVCFRPAFDETLAILKIGEVAGVVIRLRQLVQHRHIVDLERERVIVDSRHVLMPVERVDVRHRQLFRLRRDVPVACECLIRVHFRFFGRQAIILVRDVGIGLFHVCMNERTVRRRLDP